MNQLGEDLQRRVDQFIKELNDWSPSMAMNRAGISVNLAKYLREVSPEFCVAIDNYYITKKQYSNNQHRTGAHKTSKFSEVDINDVPVFSPSEIIKKQKEKQEAILKTSKPFAKKLNPRVIEVVPILPKGARG